MAKSYTTSKTIEYTGTLPMTISANGSALADYRVYGSDGGVGDDSGTPYGYVIPISVSDGTTSTITPIYVGDTPLDAIGNYADYTDYQSGKIVRKIKKQILTGSEEWKAAGNAGSGLFYVTIENGISSVWGTTSGFSMCSHYTPSIKSEYIGEYNLGGLTDAPYTRWNQNIVFNMGLSNINEVKSYVSSQYENGTPVTVWYVVEDPTEQSPPVPLPALPTCDGTTIIDYDGTPKPSQMYVKYNSWSGWEDCAVKRYHNGSWEPCTEYVRRNGVWEQQT